MKDWIWPICMAGLTFLTVLAFCALSVAALDQLDKEAARVQRFMLQNHCIVSGFYGRIGEYKIYTCNGVAIREQDI